MSIIIAVVYAVVASGLLGWIVTDAAMGGLRAYEERRDE